MIPVVDPSLTCLPSESQQAPNIGHDATLVHNHVTYRLYTRRFIGLGAMIIMGIVTGMVTPWFGPISNNVVDEYGFTLNQVNWFGNIMNLTYLPTSIVATWLCTKYGLRTACLIGASFLLISGWVRYAGTAKSLSVNGSYALTLIGQLLGGISQPFFQILGPTYSETWFDLKGRTTATMVVAIANPVGIGIAQIISPLVGDTRQSVLVLAIISTCASPIALLVGSAPPSPPTYAASQTTATFNSLARAMFGKEDKKEVTYMTRRERLDFVILVFEFGILTAVVNSFTVLTAQFFQPYGYSDDTSGFFGAALLLVGIAAAIITSPIYDRYLTHHLALSAKLLCPILGVCWLSLIWAVKPHNDGAIYFIMAVIGAASLTLLPVALELAVEVTRNAGSSAALMWFSCNILSLMFVLVEGALRAPESSNPPKNMHKALIFQGVFVLGSLVFVMLLQGKQKRREMDELRMKESSVQQEQANEDTHDSEMRQRNVEGNLGLNASNLLSSA
ncbi:major facilitator superfamily domain-containing protein [Abortiporus biennis]|nr:major facilitator superfamily domain-containing protein [Abortiporus biennis]